MRMKVKTFRLTRIGFEKYVEGTGINLLDVMKNNYSDVVSTFLNDAPNFSNDILAGILIRPLWGSEHWAFDDLDTSPYIKGADCYRSRCGMSKTRNTNSYWYKYAYW